MAFPVGWGRKQKITIDNTKVSGSGSHSDFIALITLDHLDTEVVDAGANSALNGGGDIRFSSDSAGVTQLACEVVSFVTNATPGNRKCIIWVKVPAVSASVNTELYIWYSKASEVQPPATDTYGRNAVWSDYRLVAHLIEAPSIAAGHYLDSTGNGNDGTAVALPSASSGKLHDSTVTRTLGDQTVDFPVQIDSGVGAMQAWTRYDSAVGIRQAYGLHDGQRCYVGTDAGGLHFVGWGSAYNFTESHGYSTGVYYKEDLVFNSGTGLFYVDGALKSGVTSAYTWSGPAYSGVRVLSRRQASAPSIDLIFNAAQDEFRIADFIPSADWLATEYANQNDPETFATAGTPEAGGGGDTLSINDGAHGHSGDNVTLSQVHSVTIQDSIHDQAADSVTLSQVHTLASADGAHDQTADSPVLSQVHPLGIADAAHDHSADSASLSQNHTLDSTDSAHSHAADHITLSVGNTLDVQDAAHGLSSDIATLSQVHTLALNGGLSAHSAENVSVSLEQLEALIILNATHGLRGDEVNLFDPAGFAPHPERIKPASKSDRTLQTRNSNRTNTPINNRTLRI